MFRAFAHGTRLADPRSVMFTGPFSPKSLLVWGLLAIASCGGSKGPDETQAAATTPASTARWQWVDTPKSVFARTAARANAAADGPEVERVEYWLKAIDARERALHPDTLAHVPVPHAFVIKTERADAFSNTVPVCYDVPVVFPSTEANANGPTAEGVALTFDLAAISIDARSPAGINAGIAKSLDPDDCVHVPLENEADVDALLAWIGATHTTCDVHKTTQGGAPAVALGTSCSFPFLQNQEAKKTKGAKRLILPSTANWIVVTGGIAKQFDSELYLVAVLAHELTHYYRAHLLAPRTDYEYLYQQDPDKTGKPPPADAATGAELQKVYSVLRSGESILKGQLAVAGQVLHSELFSATVDLAQTITQDTSAACAADDAACKSACDLLAPIVAGTDFSTPQTGYFGSSFPKAPLPEDATPRYLAFEQAFLACADHVKVGAPPGVGSFQFESAVSDSVAAGLLFLSLPAPATVGEGLRARSAKLDGFAADVKNAYARAEELRLGYYTREQEADDGAVEHLFDLGLDPKNAVEMVLADGKLLEQRLGEPSPPLISARACDPIYRAGWKDESGNPVYVHVGDLADTHHSMCYRAFNDDREFRLRFSGRPLPEAPPMPSGPSWEELRKSSGW